MTVVRRVLGLDRDRWARLGPMSMWPATVLAVGASLVMAWNRFGGVAADAPRAFLRLTLVGVWGWLGLAVAIWLATELVRAVSEREEDDPPPAALERTLALVGLAHAPVLLLGVVIFFSAGLLQVLGPGMVVAVFVYGFWSPALLVAAVTYALDLRPLVAVVVVSVPYAVWLLVVGRHLLDQVQHLL